jgi:hypothetical protein
MLEFLAYFLIQNMLILSVCVCVLSVHNFERIDEVTSLVEILNAIRSDT